MATETTTVKLRSAGYAPYKAYYVASLVEQAAKQDWARLVAAEFPGADITPPPDFIPPGDNAKRLNEHVKKTDLKIGIIGAGVSGLYTALILKSLDIDYEILESSDRIGGRIFTHHFSEKDHDYYDIGAMRFPHTPIMDRTFDLFERLGLGVPFHGSDPRPPGQKLMRYYLQGRNCPTRYNDKTVLLHEDQKENGEPIPPPKLHNPDPFDVSTKNGGPVPISTVSSEAGREILSDAYDRFRQKIKKAINANIKARTGTEEEKEKAREDLKRAFAYLMRHDKYSMRDYLQTVEGFDPETIHWLETVDSASGWFDQAFSEQIFESLAFDYTDPGDSKENSYVDWFCIEGGTGEVIKEMVKKLDQSKIKTLHRVNKISLEPKYGAQAPMEVTYDIYALDENKQAKKQKSEKPLTKTYSAIINTTTLGALQKIDLTGLPLTYGLKTAIRVLRYDTSTKVGIRFTEMWWKDDKEPHLNINLGGVAKTDMPLRVCVYPSYNISDTGPGVLLASYTWGQDSERVASHVKSTSPKDEEDLMDFMFYNLARLHVLSEPKDTYQARFDALHTRIRNTYDGHYAFDWSKDPHASGAFALFSPGQFSSLIPYLMRPAADSRFAIVGEHASANHAWVVGALDSAVRGLKTILRRFNLEDDIKKMSEEWNDVDEYPNALLELEVALGKLDKKTLSEKNIGHPSTPLTA